MKPGSRITCPERAETAERFEHIWENQTWWADDGKARQLEFTRVA